MSDEMIDWSELARYLAGECTPAEQERVQRWAAADAGRSAELDRLQRVWERAGEIPPAETIERMWREVASALGLEGARAAGGAWELGGSAAGDGAGARRRGGRVLTLVTAPHPARPRRA